MNQSNEPNVKYFLSGGDQLILGQRLAEGGQGKVFFVVGKPGMLAKIYHAGENLSNKKERLDHLLDRKIDALTEVAAFPLERIVDDSGSTVGFMMEYLSSWVPVHQIFQIQQRKSLMPNCDFRVLVRTAKNLSAAVARFHSSDIVIGDLNESNVFVNGSALVKLVDADSVQIEAGGQLYTCDVGRHEYIAPELQGHSLSTRRRSPEEDRFSLAVLIFQVLVFGRHPFAGRPRGSEEISLEQAIKNEWYVYHTDGCDRMKMPSGVKIDFLNFEIREMFDRAFVGDPSRRPSGQEWVDALARFEDELVACPESERHFYWRNSSGCSWCEFEKHWRMPIFGQASVVTSVGVDPAVEDYQLRLSATELPTTYELPVSDAKLDRFLDKKNKLNLVAIIALIGFMGFQLFVMYYLLDSGLGTYEKFFMISGILLLLIISAFFPIEYKLSSAKKKYLILKSEYEKQLKEWESLTGVQTFETLKTQAMEYVEALSTAEQRREDLVKTELRKTYDYELNVFLKKYSVAVASIASSSRVVLNRLYDGGIKTAADVSEESLDNFKVGQNLKHELLVWRKELEERFWSTSPYRLSESHLKRIDKEIERESLAIRRFLESKTPELEQIAEQVKVRQRQQGPELHQAFHDYEKAKNTYHEALTKAGRMLPPD